MAFNLRAVLSAVSYLLVFFGVIGALLGVLHITIGIRTACPLCGQVSPWIAARRFLGIDCERCGVFGGYPLMHIVPFKLGAVDEGTELAPDPFEEFKK